MAEHDRGAPEPRSQQDIQMRSMALRDQFKAQQSHTRAQQQQQPPLQQQKEAQLRPPPRKKAKVAQPLTTKRKRTPVVRVRSLRFFLGILFGFFQGVFISIPSTFILSVLNTTTATLRLPRAAYSVLQGIIRSEELHASVKLVLLMLLPVLILTWPIVACITSIIIGLALGFLGSIFHVATGGHLLFGGIANVLSNVFILAGHFWILHGMTDEEVTLFINILVALFVEAKKVVVSFLESDKQEKVDSIKQSPPAQAVLHAYDWLLRVQSAE